MCVQMLEQNSINFYKNICCYGGSVLHFVLAFDKKSPATFSSAVQPRTVHTSNASPGNLNQKTSLKVSVSFVSYFSLERMRC